LADGFGGPRAILPTSVQGHVQFAKHLRRDEKTVRSEFRDQVARTLLSQLIIHAFGIGENVGVKRRTRHA
jgi:hypothetical protein